MSHISNLLVNLLTPEYTTNSPGLQPPAAHLFIRLSFPRLLSLLARPLCLKASGFVLLPRKFFSDPCEARIGYCLSSNSIFLAGFLPGCLCFVLCHSFTSSAFFTLVESGYSVPHVFIKPLRDAGFSQYKAWESRSLVCPLAPCSASTQLCVQKQSWISASLALCSSMNLFFELIIQVSSTFCRKQIFNLLCKLISYKDIFFL